jgi:hypothetical protein
LDIRFLDISHKQTQISSVKCIQGVARNSVDPALPLRPCPCPCLPTKGAASSSTSSCPATGC